MLTFTLSAVEMDCVCVPQVHFWPVYFIFTHYSAFALFFFFAFVSVLVTGHISSDHMMSSGVAQFLGFALLFQQNDTHGPHECQIYHELPFSAYHW